MERNMIGERNINLLSLVVSCTPPTGDLAHNQACALTRNRTGDLSVQRPMLSALSHTSEGKI